jgi:hypothetical protein
MKEVKKHISQMTRDEIEYLMSKIHGRTPIRLTDYSQNKLKSRKIQIWQIRKAIETAELVEYHGVGRLSHRILIRGQENIRGNALCLVLDIFSGELITAYFNKFNDHHSYLDKDKYDGELDVIRYIHTQRKKK